MSAGTETPPEGGGGLSVLRIGVALALLALSLFPIGAWLDESFQRELAFQEVGWLAGAGLLALASLLVFLLLRNDRWRESIIELLRGVQAAWERRPIVSAIALGAATTVVYVFVAWSVFDARPLLIDELVQVLQARVFTEGRLWLPLDQYPEFRSIMHMVEQDGRWYGQFPPGGPAMLALGEFFGAPWIVNPVCGGVSVALLSMLLRWSGYRSGISLGASVVFAFAPFVVFQSASHMNHVPTTMWLLVSLAGLVRATRVTHDALWAGLVCGAGLGIAATIRPLDAAAFAIPAAVWFAARAVRSGHWRAFIASGVGVAVPMALMMLVNARTTGAPLTFGYTVLWGEAHGLGFHESPWGEQHTFARGTALLAAYLNRMNEYFLELPVPSLIAPLATIALTRRFAPIERYLLVTASLLLGAYFAYWHDGFYLGPRFLVPLTPLLALLVARLPSAVSGRWPHPLVARGLASACVAAVVLGAALVVPHRARSYANGFQSLRWDYDSLAASVGATGQTILVRESWGAQVIARLWGLGVSRPFAEVLYRKVDTCGLDHMTAHLQRAGVHGDSAEARLRPLLADSARVVSSPFSPDGSERVLPGSVYPPDCLQRIAEDRAGYTHFAPTLLARDGQTRWLRDLQARDTLVVSRGEELWLLRRVPDADPVTPVLIRLPRDSVDRTWYGRDTTQGTPRGNGIDSTGLR